MCDRRFKPSHECLGTHMEREKEGDAQGEHITNISMTSHFQVRNSTK